MREKNKPEGKKRKRLHRFNTTWLDVREFKDWLIRSDKYKKDEPLIEYGMCKVCNVEIFPNKNDILRHGKTEKHTSLLKTVKGNRDMRDMMKDQSHFYSVKNAEIILAAAITELNISFNSMDKLSPLFTKMFPDSKIAKDFSCKRTKTTLIVKENLGKHFQEELFTLLQRCFFSLIMDETTDVGTKKQCAYTIIFYCDSKNKTVTRFFDMVELTSGKASDLYDALKSCLSRKKIPLKNLIGFSSDTTNVMVGEQSSVFSHLKKRICHTLF